MLRKRVYNWLEPGEQAHPAEKLIDATIVTLILLSVAVVMLQSMPALSGYLQLFDSIERFCVYFFTAEYVLRLWTCVENPKYSEPVRGRLRYAKSSMAVIDLLAIAPFYLAPVAKSNAVVFRLFRIFRLARLLKMGRYYQSLGMLGRILRSRREELIVSAGLVIVLVVMASTLMYAVEHDAQPEAFSSIPASVWWGVVTMTTVGYGDVYPITPVGRAIAGVALLLGVGLFALPAGILASGFSEEMTRRRLPASSGAQKCPHCGRDLDEQATGTAASP